MVVRPFNHIGPGQSPNFAVPALAKRIVEAKKSGARSLLVGTLTTRRDFTDVRDVVVAYRLLVTAGKSREHLQRLLRAGRGHLPRSPMNCCDWLRWTWTWSPIRTWCGRSTCRSCGETPACCVRPPAGFPRSHSRQRSPTSSLRGSRTRGVLAPGDHLVSSGSSFLKLVRWGATNNQK